MKSSNHPSSHNTSTITSDVSGRRRPITHSRKSNNGCRPIRFQLNQLTVDTARSQLCLRASHTPRETVQADFTPIEAEKNNESAFVSQVVTQPPLLCTTKPNLTECLTVKTYDHGNRLQDPVPTLQHGIRLLRRSIIRHAASLRRVRELRRDGASDTLSGLP